MKEIPKLGEFGYVSGGHNGLGSLLFKFLAFLVMSIIAVFVVRELMRFNLNKHREEITKVLKSSAAEDEESKVGQLEK